MRLALFIPESGYLSMYNLRTFQFIKQLSSNQLPIKNNCMFLHSMIPLYYFTAQIQLQLLQK